jgi:hypothetical protein
LTDPRRPDQRKDWASELSDEERAELDLFFGDVLSLDHAENFGHSTIWDFDDAPAEHQLIQAKYDFEGGDLLAVYRAVEVCHRSGLPIPQWATPELAREARRILKISRDGDKRFREAQTWARDRAIMIARFAAVEAAMVENPDATQVRHLDIAQHCLKEDGINIEVDSLKTVYNRVKKEKIVRPKKKIALYRQVIQSLQDDGIE